MMSVKIIMILQFDKPLVSAIGKLNRVKILYYLHIKKT